MRKIIVLFVLFAFFSCNKNVEKNEFTNDILIPDFPEKVSPEISSSIDETGTDMSIVVEQYLAETRTRQSIPLSDALPRLKDKISDSITPDEEFSIIINAHNAEDVSYNNVPPDLMAYLFASLFLENNNYKNILKYDNTREMNSIWRRFYKDTIIQIGIPKIFFVNEYTDDRGVYHHRANIWVYVQVM